MRLSNFILIQFLLIVVVGSIVYTHKDRVSVIKTPPASLAQWYMPENKRQVWLHNMFNLRREMQAVRLYADSLSSNTPSSDGLSPNNLSSTNKDAKHLQEWLTRLNEHYLEISKMVPEWEKKLDMETMTRLQGSAKAGRYQDVTLALDTLTEGCESCHTDYRIITANMYRAPDFSSIKINTSTTYKEHMKKLTQQVNHIKIAFVDDKKDVALSTLADLKEGINAQGETCSNCHKKDKKVYPGDAINKTIISLEQSLKTGTLKDQGQALGTLAVMACARCHGTHRLAYDTRKTFTDGPNWAELIRH